MKDLIIIGIIVLILGLAITYIVKAKKSGVKCIGCPSSKICSGHCDSKEIKEEMPEFISTSKHTCSGNCSHCSSCDNSDIDI